MIENPTRTFSENIDAFGDIYAISDMLRDINYGLTKTKQIAYSIYKDAPGFVVRPDVGLDDADNLTINIGAFIAIDAEYETIMLDYSTALKVDSFTYGEIYYIVANKTSRETDDIRTNKSNRNVSYSYILEENISIEIKKDKALTDICIATFVAHMDVNTTLPYLILDLDDQTRSIKNIYDAYTELQLYKAYVANNYISKQKYNEITHDGHIVKELAADVDFPDELENNLVPGLNSDGKVDSHLIDSVKVVDGIIRTSSLPAGNADPAINTETVIVIDDKDRRMEIWVGKITPDVGLLYADLMFDDNGAIYEIHTSSNIHTGETTEFVNTLDCVYFKSSVREDGGIELRVKNNFLQSIVIKYRFI